MRQQRLALNRPWEAQDIAGQMHPTLSLHYIPDAPETGICLAALASGGLYTSLNLTQQETLELVKILRQIPAIEQATIPDMVAQEVPEEEAQSA